MRVDVKRIYEAPGPGDGTRVLVDRVWPRGLSKDKAAVDHWFKDVAPSSELRRWFGHDPKKWDEFRSRYTRELEGNLAAVEELVDTLRAGGGGVLLFAARDTQHNNAVALKHYLEDRFGL